MRSSVYSAATPFTECDLTPLVLCEADHGRQAARLGLRWLDWRRFLVEGPGAAT